MKNVYYYFESNWGVTFAVTHHPNFDTLTWLELDAEFNLRPNRVYLRSRSGVIVDSDGEVIDDLKLTSECEAHLKCVSESDAQVSIASASAKKLKLGGLSFGEKAFIQVKKPALVEWTFREV